MYEDAAFPELKERGFSGTWLDWFLKEIETFHGTSACGSQSRRRQLVDRHTAPFRNPPLAAKARRYTSPDEHPFTALADLPVPILLPQSLPPLLHQHSVNVNGAIKRRYLDNVVPAITRGLGLADDGNYGSAATRDVEVLQAISRRVHFGPSPSPRAAVLRVLGRGRC